MQSGVGFRDAAMIQRLAAPVGIGGWPGVVRPSRLPLMAHGVRDVFTEGWGVAQLTLDPWQWAQEQFGECDLGDIRRTRRAIRFAAQVASDTSGSTPRQTETWKDCKAAYRLIDNDDV